MSNILDSVGSLRRRSQATHLVFTVTSVRCISTHSFSINIIQNENVFHNLVSSTSVSLAFEIIYRLEYKIPKPHSTVIGSS